MSERPRAADADEVTADPEATSAADAEWLEQVRVTAKQRRQPMSELLDEAPSDHTVEADSDAMDAIREAVRAERGPTPGSHDDLADAASPLPSEKPPPRPKTIPAPRVQPSRQVTTAAPDDSARLPRWQPPPRLSGATSAPVPTIAAEENRRRHFPVWLVIAAVVLAVALGFAAAQLFDGDAGEPSTTSVPSEQSIDPSDSESIDP